MKMNEKGFTLIEMLATIVILGIVMGITGYSVIGTINNSKARSEEIFVEKIGLAIEEYLSIYGSNLSSSETEYCIRECGTEDEVSIKKVGTFQIKKITETKVLDENKVINPKNKLKCFSSKNPNVTVYKDTEYVYYYYVDLSSTNTDCDISEEVGFISNFPKKVVTSLKGKTTLPAKLTNE